MIKDLIRHAIGDAPKVYVNDDDTYDQVQDDFLAALNEIQEEYGVIFEFYKVKGKELYWRLLPRE